MDKKYYFNTFSKQEDVFEYVWNRFPVGIKPTWQHFWLYRFLQISPSYCTTCWTLGSRDKEMSDHYYKVCKNSARVLLNGYLMGDVWRNDFIGWWYGSGMYQFSSSKIDNVNVLELGKFTTSGIIRDKDVKKTIKQVSDLFSYKKTRAQYPETRIIALPIYGSKNHVQKIFELYLKNNVNFPQEKISDGFFKFQKSKITNKSLFACYKVLELRCVNPSMDLPELGVEANVLRATIAGTRIVPGYIQNMSSVDSLRSGTSRQISMALHLSENAAIGSFPNIRKSSNHMKVDYSRLSNLYKYLLERDDATYSDLNRLLKLVSEYVDAIDNRPECFDIPIFSLD